MNIHTYLEKTKYRALVLAPPLILCLIGVGVACVASITNDDSYVNIPIVRWGFVAGAIWLILGQWLILWSDYKRGKL